MKRPPVLSLFVIGLAGLFTLSCASAGGGSGSSNQDASNTTGGGGDAAFAAGDAASTTGGGDAASTTGGDVSTTGGDDIAVEEDAGPIVEPTPSIPVLGWGQHTFDYVGSVLIATSGDGLATPRDLEFDPENPDDMWIVSLTNETMTVVWDANTNSQSSGAYNSPGSAHFFARPSALAFGTKDTLATIHETDQLTQGPNGTPPDFMGPTLQSTELNTFDAGHGSHLDMLHNSPNGMGIAWEKANVYWVFDGYHSSITRYDFKSDHGKGGTYHGDGIIERYVEGEVSRVAGVPSHMEMDRDSGMLYIADTGNKRIAVLDTSTGTKGSAVGPFYDTDQQYKMNGAVITTLIDGNDVTPVMKRPCGLALHDEYIFVSDNQTGIIFGFDRDGELVDYLDTEMDPGALMGIAFNYKGELGIVDAFNDAAWLLTPIADPGL